MILIKEFVHKSYYLRIIYFSEEKWKKSLIKKLIPANSLFMYQLFSLSTKQYIQNHIRAKN